MTNRDDTSDSDLATPPAVRSRSQSEAEPAHEDDVPLRAPAPASPASPPAGHPSPAHKSGRPEGLDALAISGALGAKATAAASAATAGAPAAPEVMPAPPVPAGGIERRH
ncbi:MAG TPA: hypothetical protein VFZ11_07185, partial [Gemmatimonadaceae bacterium]